MDKKLNTKKTEESSENNANVEEILKNATLEPPRSAFNQFLISKLNSPNEKGIKNKNDTKRQHKLLTQQWEQMEYEQKKEYFLLYEEEKKRYKNNVKVVKRYLFPDYNKNITFVPTPFYGFLYEELKYGLETNMYPDLIEKEARKKWLRMSKEEKNKYKDISTNNSWLIASRNIRVITPLTLYIQKVIHESIKEKKKKPTETDIKIGWNKLSKVKKATFELYAQKINEDREKLRDLYNIVHGAKPKKPVGAYRMFLQEKAKNKEIKSINQGLELWKKLSEDQKEEYLKKSHKRILAYKYQEMIYNKKIKKIIPKKPKSVFQQFLKEKKGIKAPNDQNWHKYWKNVFDKLSPSEKAKYEDKFSKAKKEYDKEMMKFQNKVFDFPKKPISSYTFYVREKLPILKQKINNSSIISITKKIAEEWNNLSEKEIKHYQQMSNTERKRYSEQLKEFLKYGYYTKTEFKTMKDGEWYNKSHKKKSNTLEKFSDIKRSGSKPRNGKKK